MSPQETLLEELRQIKDRLQNLEQQKMLLERRLAQSAESAGAAIFPFAVPATDLFNKIECEEYMLYKRAGAVKEEISVLTPSKEKTDKSTDLTTLL